MVVFLPLSPSHQLSVSPVAMTLTRAHSCLVSVYSKVGATIEPPEFRRIVNHCHSQLSLYSICWTPLYCYCAVMRENSGCESS